MTKYLELMFYFVCLDFLIIQSVVCVSVCVYIYMHIYIHIDIYIYWVFFFQVKYETLVKCTFFMHSEFYTTSGPVDMKSFVFIWLSLI